MYQICTGIVLRRMRYSESSLIVTLLTREYGRIDGLAKGARRPKSLMFGHLELFNLEEVQVAERSRASLDLVTEAFVLKEFNGLRELPEAYWSAGVLAEVLLRLCMVRDPHPMMFDLMALALTRLSAGCDVGMTVLSAMFGFLKDAGLAPVLDTCLHCGKSGCGGILSAQDGGLICSSCLPQSFGRPRFTDAARRAMFTLAKGSLRERDSLCLSAKQSGKLVAIVLRYVEDAMQRALPGKEMLVAQVSAKGMS